MAIPKVMNGARAKVYITEPGQAPRLVGIFSSFSYNVTYTAAPVDTLGRYGAAEIEYTGIEPVNINATGWRVIGQGPHKAGAVPKWQDLLFHDYLTITVTDRATGVIANIEKVRPLGYSTSLQAKQLTEVPINYVGILCSDEDGAHAFLEDGSASDLP